MCLFVYVCIERKQVPFWGSFQMELQKNTSSKLKKNLVLLFIFLEL